MSTPHSTNPGVSVNETEAVLPPNAPPAGNVEVQQQGRLPGLPSTRHSDPPTSDALASFLATTRTDVRYLIAPAKGYNELGIVYINFAFLAARISAMLHAAFDDWYELRTNIPGTAADIDAFIANACTALSMASVYMVYILLGSKTGHHASQYSNRYRPRAPLDKYYELPTGLMLIIEKFGFWQTSEMYNNPGIMMVWDHQDAATFGFPVGTQFNQSVLNAITQILRRLNVPFRRLNLACPTITGWFSLFIRPSMTGVGIDVYTTFPISNYQLPLDIFLAGLIQSDSEIDGAHQNPVEFVGYRMASIENGDMANWLQGHQPDSFTMSEGNRFPIIPGGQDPPLDLHLPLAGFERTHPSGVRAERTGGTDVQPTYSRRAYIFGRGGISTTLIINVVARNVTSQDLINFAQVLFRKGVPA